MITTDYGKRAYLKLQEIENKINLLEKEQQSFNYSELKLKFGGATSVYTFDKTLTVDALKEGRFNFKGSFCADNISTLGIITKIYVNDVLNTNFVCVVDADFPFNFQTTLLKGVNTIRVLMTSTSPFNLEYFNLEVNGFITYAKSQNNLSIVTENSRDYILNHYQTNTDIYLYERLFELKLIRRIYNVNHTSLIGSDSDYLYLACVNLNNVLSIKRLNKSTFYLEDFSLGVGGVQFVAGYKIANGFKILFCKLYSLYEGFYNTSTNTFSYINTGKKGVKVYAEPNYSDIYVITDRLGESKFVLENGVILNIGQGENYHFIKTQTGYNIEFVCDGKVVMQTVENGKVKESKTVDYCDERLLLGDGYYLTRQNNDISIKKE